jgi:alpha-L-fucosidase 2
MKRYFTLFLIVTALSSIAQIRTNNLPKKKYQLWYNSPAPNRGPNKNIEVSGHGTPWDEDWENWSLPIGNGYLGASVFGRTDTERVQLTENSLSNKGLYGIGSLTNFAELYLDFNHSNPTNYKRSLSLNNAISYVNYDFDNVHYSREYFASYPDKVLVIKLKANIANKVSFTLHSCIPYLRSSDSTALKDNGRTGIVSAKGNLITLSGNMQYYDIDYEGQFKVIHYGGTLKSENDSNGDHGKITVNKADSVMIIVALGTNYQMKSSVFTEPNPSKKLVGFEHPHQRVSEIINNASKKTYQQLVQNHLHDYKKFFSRADIDFGAVESILPTDQLLANYKAKKVDHYLEELYFQYGRYLLISSSRTGTLPSNLQGIWNQYDVAPWTSGYWHNVNVQMNYWPVFNTNLAELFTSYVDYNKAFRNAATRNADNYVKQLNPKAYTAGIATNGWAIGTGASPYAIHSPGSHSGPGTGGFTAKLFWDQFEFTQDLSALKSSDYPAMLGMANFLSKVVKEKDGLLLTNPSASPEQKVNDQNYETIGCAFDQEMIYENHADVLKAAKLLNNNNEAVEKIKYQLDKLDPIQVGWSGQIKEYREEKKYGDIGEYHHRHISQLVGLYPGTIINANTPAWLDAAKVTLNERGDVSKGWSMAHRMNLWARVKDGDRAYKLYQDLLQQGTYDNLWDAHPPFQIDGNFGGTAGVAEMLLQSHQGYIEPLAALPLSWPKGSYKGLVARGNFEFDVAWENGSATSFNIKSRAGQVCKIYYPNITRAILKDHFGKPVPYQKFGENLISFNTKKGQFFKVSSIPKFKKIVPPKNLIIKEKEDIALSWEISNEAKTYSIYIALDHSPIYKLIADKLTIASFNFKSEALNNAERGTLKVVAVDKNNQESEGALAYWINKSIK